MSVILSYGLGKEGKFEKASPLYTHGGRGQVTFSHCSTTQIPCFQNLWIPIVDAIGVADSLSSSQQILLRLALIQSNIQSSDMQLLRKLWTSCLLKPFSLSFHIVYQF